MVSPRFSFDSCFFTVTTTSSNPPGIVALVVVLFGTSAMEDMCSSSRLLWGESPIILTIDCGGTSRSAWCWRRTVNITLSGISLKNATVSEYETSLNFELFTSKISSPTQSPCLPPDALSAATSRCYTFNENSFHRIIFATSALHTQSHTQLLSW